MARSLRAGLCFGMFGFLCCAGVSAEDVSTLWPQWRGPTGNGVAEKANIPLTWSETENIRWKIEIPGYGHATPIVWGDYVYVQSAVPANKDGKEKEGGLGSFFGGKPTEVHEFVVMAIKRKSGEIVWKQTVCEGIPHEKGHADASQASNSPVTDGEHIYAYFGSRGLYCLTMKGEVVWKRAFGEMRTRMAFGEGSSPALYKDTLIVTWDHEGQSAIIAMDKKTGKDKWRVNRDEPTSWSTPVVVEVAGEAQVIANATRRITSYDVASGRVVWECSGMTGNVVPTPMVGNGMVYCASGFRGTALLAIKYAEAKGDVTDTPAVVWKYDGKGTPYVPTPLLYENKIFFLKGNKALLSCVDALSGEILYTKQRIGGVSGVYASLVGVGGKVLVAGLEGKTAVIECSGEFKVLAINELEDGFSASPAIAGDELYLRGAKYLYCISKN